MAATKNFIVKKREKVFFGYIHSYENYYLKKLYCNSTQKRLFLSIIIIFLLTLPPLPRIFNIPEKPPSPPFPAKFVLRARPPPRSAVVAAVAAAAAAAPS